MSADPRPLRLLFFMLHAGFLRFYRRPIELLAERGHEVHLAFTMLEKDPGDTRLAEELAAAQPADHIRGGAPAPAGDGWRPLAGLVRSLIDLGRYVDPRYADSPALRARMARKFADHVSTARAVDPITARLTLRLIRFMDSRSSERLSRRIVGASRRRRAGDPDQPQDRPLPARAPARRRPRHAGDRVRQQPGRVPEERASGGDPVRGLRGELGQPDRARG